MPDSYLIAGVAKVSVHVPPVGIKLTKSDARPWEEKWTLILHNRDRLEDIYRGQMTGAGNLDAESAANNVFVECHNLNDWLKWTLPGGITKKAVNDFFRESGPLTEAAALSNSHKHHTRNDGGMLARIRQYESDSVGSGCKMECEMYWGDESRSYTKDALALADECVAEWRKFFRKHNIPEP